MSKKYYTYILTHERNHIFYVGVTNNIERRMSEHKTATHDPRGLLQYKKVSLLRRTHRY
ncbi:GIY-YIG nuclease family protein [Subsaximicrobium wynnwilliamsii]|uniref:GIY-YIG nuclease family protein n=1 Tax=Subsaximicrobium wynnwilliamsii TaxID=291179 RepID=UPI001CB8D8B0|nr:GIY-YIG nuclease family protein [Subsaximicrobium wynnwilliamsii]